MSAAFWFALPDLAAYRGLSGVDCALGGLLAGSLLRTALEDGRLRGAAVAAGIATFLAGKIAWEVGTGGTLFVPSMGAGVVAVPLAHAVGGAVGALIGSWPRRGAFARLWRWIGRLESPKLPIGSSAAMGRQSIRKWKRGFRQVREVAILSNRTRRSDQGPHWRAAAQPELADGTQSRK